MKRLHAFAALLGLAAFVGCDADHDAPPASPDAGITAPADTETDLDAAAPADAEADTGIELDADGTAPIDASPDTP